MRPDLDDFDELDTPEAPRSRAMSWMVLVVAVAGFGALAYYAYRSGTQGAHDGDMLVVQADNTPIKQAPADAGGEQFPNKDKTIYDVIAPAGGEQKAEKMLPDPEHAVAPKEMDAVAGDEDSETPTPATTTYVKNADAGAAPPTEVKATAQTTGQPAATVSAAVATTPPATAVAAVKESPSIGAPTMINEKPHKKEAATDVSEVPVAGVKDTKTVKVATAKSAAAKAATTSKSADTKSAKAQKAAAGASGTGSYKVQLGAYKSEDDAKAAWKKITGKYGDTFKGSPAISSVESNGATLYRLRAGGFASNDAAKSACAKLSPAKQPCMPVGK